MPRRPRPINRRPPQQSASTSKHADYPVQQTVSKRAPPEGRSRPTYAEPQTESEEDSEDQDVLGHSDGSEQYSEDEEDADADAPRVAQYVDEEELEDDLEEVSQSESSDGEDEYGAGPSNLVRMKIV